MATTVFTTEEKQILANKIFELIDKLNVAIQQAHAAGLTTNLVAIPGICTISPVVKALVNEIVPFADPNAQRPKLPDPAQSSTDLEL
jgi:hypothetical protein